MFFFKKIYLLYFLLCYNWNMTFAFDLDLTLVFYNRLSPIYKFCNSIDLNRGKNSKYSVFNNDEGICKVSFMNKVVKLFNPKMYTVYDKVVETIKTISELGHNILIVTNRPNLKPVRILTMMQLKENNIPYNKLILGCKNKYECAKKENVDVFVDNGAKICKTLASNNIKTIMFNEEQMQETPNLKQFVSWIDINDYFFSKSGIINTIKESDKDEVLEYN